VFKLEGSPLNVFLVMGLPAIACFIAYKYIIESKQRQVHPIVNTIKKYFNYLYRTFDFSFNF
jgi:hypothetical protein